MTIAVNSTGLILGAANIIIGGNFDTNPWQRGTSFTAVANNTYTADRFSRYANNDGVVDIFKTADAPTIAQAGIYSANCFHVDVTTADGTISAGQYDTYGYNIEGYDSAPYGFGQSNAMQLTLSFWHKHTVTGTYCVGLTNGANDRSYIAEYTQAVTDTWEKAKITFTADTSGTWLYTNGRGLRIYFVNACGSTFQTSANTWTAGQFFATSNQVNGLSSTSNNFKLALVKLEPGPIATPYPVELEANVLARCLRYCYVANAANRTNAAIGTFDTTTVVVNGQFDLPVPMRSSPTVTQSGTTANYVLSRVATSNASAASLQAASNLASQSFSLNWTSAGASTAGFPTSMKLTSDATLIISAEL